MAVTPDLTNIQFDLLKEIGNIGSGNAATALSRLLETKVDMKVPSVRVAGFEETMELVGGPEEVIFAIFIRIQGEVPGNMFFVLSPVRAEKFVHQMTGNHDFSLASAAPDSLGISFLQEAGNILAGSYLSALADFTQLHFYATVPVLKLDIAGAILAEGLMEVSAVSDYAIIIDTLIEETGEENKLIQGHFFLLPDPDSFSAIFTALGADEK